MTNKEQQIQYLEKEIEQLKNKKEENQKFREKKSEYRRLKYGEWNYALVKVFGGIFNVLKSLWKSLVKMSQNQPQKSPKEKSNNTNVKPVFSNNINKLSESTSESDVNFDSWKKSEESK